MTQIIEEKKDEDFTHVESAAPPEGYQYAQIDPVVQKRTVRKLDKNLMPLVVALCMSIRTPP